MSQPQLILASGSPRRHELLREAGYQPRVAKPRDGAEQPGLCSGCGPAELVVNLAQQKLDDVIDQLSDEPGSWLVLAADTVAECGGRILGKPTDEQHAREMMASLSGREHRVYTGVCLSRLEAGVASQAIRHWEETTLRMDTLSEAWIDEYAKSDKWEGKAGGFGYQDGLGFVHVINGSESNVVGLPMESVCKLLSEYGRLPEAPRHE